MGGRGSSSTSAQKPSEKELKSLDSYILDKNGEVANVRQVQMGIYNGSDKVKYDEMGKTIEEYIHKNKGKSGILFRGIRDVSDEYSNLKQGAVIDQRGTSSWSSDISVAHSVYSVRPDIPGKRVMFVSENPKNSADVAKFSSITHEKEHLYSKDQKFIVTENYVDSQGTRWIHVREKR